MQPDDRDAAHLWDMRDYANTVRRLVEHIDLEAYRRDTELQLAVERAVEIIGEAARRVSAEFQRAHPEIPWARIIAQRNVLAHDYDVIDIDLFWLTVSESVPGLVALLEPLVPPTDD